MGQSTPNVPSGVLPPAGGVTPLSRPLTGLTHNAEPFLDAKYLHPTANGAQRTGTEPPLMSAYFPKPRGTLPTTWAPYGWQVSCEKYFWEVWEMALRIIEMYACAERKLVLNTINCIVKVRKTRSYGPVFFPPPFSTAEITPYKVPSFWVLLFHQEVVMAIHRKLLRSLYNFTRELKKTIRI